MFLNKNVLTVKESSASSAPSATVGGNVFRWVTGKVQTIVASPRGAFLKPVYEEVEVTERIQIPSLDSKKAVFTTYICFTLTCFYTICGSREKKLKYWTIIKLDKQYLAVTGCI